MSASRQTPTPRSAAARTRAVLLAVLAVASFGAAIPVVMARSRAEEGPPGWILSYPQVPVRIAAEAGEVVLPGKGWPLGSMGRLERPVSQGEGLGLDLVLPEEGSLRVLLHDRLGAQAYLDLEPSRIRLGSTATTCRGARADGEFGTRPLEVRLDRTASGGIQALVEGPGVRQELACAAGLAALARVELRAGMRRVRLLGLDVGDGPPLRSSSSGLALSVLGGLVGGALGLGIGRGARGLWAGRLWALSPLLLALPLSLQDVEAMLQQLRILADQPLRWALGLPLAVTLALVLLQALGRYLEADRSPARPAVLAGLAPAALVLAGGGLGLLALGPVGAWALPLGALGVGLLTALCSALGPGAAPRRAVIGALFLGLLAGGGALAMQPRDGAAALWVALSAAAVGLLLWANVRARLVRGFNLLSLALSLVALVAAEKGLAATATGQRLLGVSARAHTEAAQRPANARKLAESDQLALSSFDSLDHEQRFTPYPMGRYPVEPPPRAAPLRIVALGSSSTAGAWQNDSIDEFWPADLGRALGPAIQVVNQGVGGWTSLHIRRYVETRLDLIDPDIVVIYQGNNDSFNGASRPYRELYSDLADPPDAWRTLSGGLERIALVQLLKAVLRPDLLPVAALHEAEGVVAVPAEDARDNLSAIIELLRARGGRVLLVAEGINPRPGPEWEFPRVMAELALAPDVAWLDANDVLEGPDHFLDSCHLSRRGHEQLSEAVLSVLCAEGWLGAHAACATAAQIP